MGTSTSTSTSTSTTSKSMCNYCKSRACTEGAMCVVKTCVCPTCDERYERSRNKVIDIATREKRDNKDREE